MFTQIKPFNIEVAAFGKRHNRVTIFRLINGTDDWQMIQGSRAILIGGEKAETEMKKLLDSSNGGLSRSQLDSAVPSGLDSRTHSNFRKFVGLV